MLQKVRQTIEKYKMLDAEDRVGVAVSGGPDSIALLRVMTNIAAEFRLSLVIIHVNHDLRGEESEREERFVRTLGESMKIPVAARKISIPAIRKREQGSVENISRRERYGYFEEVKESYSLDKIALGHNQDDQAETVIMKFLRGSGLEGLRGILPVRDGMYVRPLIEATREEILVFLREEGAQYMTDSSNVDDIYVRNRIRNRLIPALKEQYNPRLAENIARMADIIRLENDFIEQYVKDALLKLNIIYEGNKVGINIPDFKLLPPVIRLRIIKRLLQNRSSSKMKISYVHVKAVIGLIEGPRSNGLLDLPLGIMVRREYDNLTIVKDEVSSKLTDPHDKNKKRKDDKWGVNDYYYDIFIPGTVKIKEAGLTIDFSCIGIEQIDFNAENTVFMDYDSLTFPLIIRNIRAGDRMQPLGLGGTKKVKSIFIDKKIPRSKRGKTPLLVDQISVLWIPGIKLSDRVRVTDATKTVLRAEII
ncbi:MAG: tRNA lysidine(34) synthetase TilS [Deltaproteobacteria bacterium]|nr:tRNA lysidine(34) synthetase TilS [Deltaproteobacteria bacterium]